MPNPKTRNTALYGAVAWAASIQFFLAQAVVQSAWTEPFSLTRNYISDLGNTACGPYMVGPGEIMVCSPWYALMNASFILQGVLMVFGSAALWSAFPASRVRATGLGLIALAGIGVMLVGLYPENVNLPIHKAGAAAQFIGGNIALVVLGFSMPNARDARPVAVFSAVSGLVGAVSTALFAADIYLAFDVGGMERLAAYPLPFCLIVLGVYLALSSSGRQRLTP